MTTIEYPEARMLQQQRQLTLDVLPHPALQHGDGGALIGEVTLAGEVLIDRDLNAGSRLVVIVQDEDGQVLGTGEYEVGPVKFVPIIDKDVGVIGTRRIHGAKPQT